MVKVGDIVERKCIRCDESMILNCNLKVYEGGGALFAHRPIYSIYRETTGWGKDEDIKIAVCPKCGYVEPYVQFPEKLL